MALVRIVGKATHWRWTSGVLVGGVGIVTGILHVDHLIENTDTMPVVSAIVFPLCLSVGLVGAGYWIGQSDYTAERVVTIAGWSILGAVILALLGRSILIYQHAVGVLDASRGIIIVPSSVTEGTAIGFVFGVYATRSNRQTARGDQDQE